MQKKRLESDCGNYPDQYQYSEKPHYDNPPYESKDPKMHKWPKGDLDAYVIDGILLAICLGAIAVGVRLIVNSIN